MYCCVHVTSVSYWWILISNHQGKVVSSLTLICLFLPEGVKLGPVRLQIVCSVLIVCSIYPLNHQVGCWINVLTHLPSSVRFFPLTPLYWYYVCILCIFETTVDCIVIWNSVKFEEWPWLKQNIANRDKATILLLSDVALLLLHYIKQLTLRSTSHSKHHTLIAQLLSWPSCLTFTCIYQNTLQREFFFWASRFGYLFTDVMNVFSPTQALKGIYYSDKCNGWHLSYIILLKCVFGWIIMEGTMLYICGKSFFRDEE